MLALDDYLEKMRTLKEAIAFFSTHLTYKNKLEHVVRSLLGRSINIVILSEIDLRNWLFQH